MTAGRVEPSEEEALVERAAAGDVPAFGELVRRHQQEVFGLAVRLLGDRELAADVSQDALVRAWRALPSFRRDSAFSTWLHRITVNTAWTARRRAHRHRGPRLDAVPEPGFSTEHPAHPERMGGSAVLRRSILAALDRLPPGSRAVVVLKDVHGWTHAEIADTLGITVTAAKVRLHRARARLRVELEDLR